MTKKEKAELAEETALVVQQMSPSLPELTINRPPDEVLLEAHKAAAAIKLVIDSKKKKVVFNGEVYPEFEDWQTVARFYGATVKVRSTKYVEYGEAQGFEATADVLLVNSGQIISAAEAMCMNDEPNWMRKPLFQLRSMAQTRACAKALRNVFASVVVLAGYRPTPAEEMIVDETRPQVQRKSVPKSAPVSEDEIELAQKMFR